jgi:hypothetical protein
LKDTVRILAALFMIPSLAIAQRQDSVIIKAMKDELRRNMSELRYDGFEKPFYIAYSIDDVTEFNVASSMGGLLRSNESRSRAKNIRVLVGNYEFNDESLDDNNSSPSEANEIQLPLDNDYFGIRRSLWVTTDYIYKSAARQYKKNLETLQEKNKTIETMPHRRFASKPVVSITMDAKAYPMNLKNFERDLNALTEVFSRYPLIEYSGAYMSFVKGYTYFVNSEGSLARTPIQQATMQIYAQRKTTEGETIHDMLVYNGITPDDFPSQADLMKKVVAMSELLVGNPVKPLDEEYSGPVLIVGQKLAETMGRTMFTSRESLSYSDALPDPRGRQQDPAASIDSKLGKPVVNENLTVRVRSGLKEYKGTTLLGSYPIDREGVVPEEDVLLIENGILRNLLNDRSLIKPDERATGHASGPGVVEISVKGGIGFQKLREQLIAEAKKQGLDFGLIIEEELTDNVPGVKATKIFINGNKDEVFKGGMIQALTLKDLKSMIGASDQIKVYNLYGRGNQNITSYIIPEAMLLRDVEVNKEDTRLFKEEKYISNPLQQ